MVQDNQALHSDILIVGAGPAGLSFARAVAKTGLKITLVEKSPESVLQNPPYDGREIALTHLSKELMQKLDMWDRVAKEDIYFLRDAKVLNGESDYLLHFPQPDTARGRPTDTLGYLISNHNIRRVAYESAKACENIHFVCGVGVKEVITGQPHQITLEDGRQLTANLLIAADSRFSHTRRQLGISADTHEFGRTVMVFRTEHTQSNYGTAMECFFYGRTLALLPLGEHMTNCVITIDTNRAHTVLDLNKEELAADMQQLLKGRLGDMKVISDTHTYPLVGVHARSFYAYRSALIGDAAVGMHPVTAHGFNLGLQGADILAQEVIKAFSAGKDYAAEPVLKAYNCKHAAHTRVMYHGTNTVVKLFTHESAPAKFLREFVIKASNNLPPVKFLISRQLTG